MPIAITRREPNRSTSGPAGSANATRISANALITLAAAATPTPNGGRRRGCPRHDRVAERHGERHRGQDRRLARQASERAAPGLRDGFGGSRRHAGRPMPGR
jgi:hypothetical protein